MFILEHKFIHLTTFHKLQEWTLLTCSRSTFSVKSRKCALNRRSLTMRGRDCCEAGTASGELGTLTDDVGEWGAGRWAGRPVNPPPMIGASISTLMTLSMLPVNCGRIYKEFPLYQIIQLPTTADLYTSDRTMITGPSTTVSMLPVNCKTIHHFFKNWPNYRSSLLNRSTGSCLVLIPHAFLPSYREERLTTYP